MDTAFDKDLETSVLSFLKTQNRDIRVALIWEHYPDTRPLAMAKVLAFSELLETYIVVDHPDIGKREFSSIVDIPVDGLSTPMTFDHTTFRVRTK